jgi:dipeptidyl aminopeptidase/acylaminoacyl peptidase
LPRACFALAGFGVLLLVAGGLGATQATHPFSVHDMLAMERVSDPQSAPDGGRVVFVVRLTDLEANRGRTDLWLVSTDGTGLRRLTSHEGSDSNPRWDPDGRTVWFLSDRGGSSQVWRIPSDGGEAQQATSEPLDVGNLLVAPDGKHIAYTMEVFPDAQTLQETKDRLDRREKSKSSGRIYDRLFVRHWDSWEDGRRSHLFVRPVADGNVVDVMKGMDADTPSQPFGGPEEITFTPDDKGIIFTARNVGRQEAWSTNFDLYYAPVDGSEPPKCLTSDNEAWDTCPAFSPDGKTLAYLAMSKPGYEADQFRIMLRDWPAGGTRQLAENWDRSPSTIAWSADGRSIYAAAANAGQESLFSIDIAGGSARIIVKEGTVHAFDVAKDQVVYSLSSLRSPAELYSVRPDVPNAPSAPKPEVPPLPPGVRQITSINADKVAAARMGDCEQFTFLGWNEETIFAYVVKPVDFDPAQKYPVAFLIHGGPQGSFGNIFHYRWNAQAYAGAGYAVVMVDFHGSVGYGQAFCDSICGDWGGKPLLDLQKGLAAALARYPWMDGGRVGALGASYGGYMVNWIAGQWPDRFRCFVNHDGNLDERFAYFDTEELWFPERDHRGTFWDNPAGYEEQNPLRFVGNWKTPMLVIHGEQDFRIPASQGLGTFTALQRRGIPSRLLYFPDENHWVVKPHNSILWHETVLAWLDQWLKTRKE